MKLIIGLGNPGKKYEKTRHNIGFMVVEQFLKDFEPERKTEWVDSPKFKSDIAELEWQPKHGNLEKVILVKPKTYMNNSGMAIQLLSSFYKTPLEDIWVIHDDIDLPLGSLRIRLGGASAGNRGVESTLATLGNDKFWRFRLGIGHPRRDAKILGHEGRTKPVDEYVVSSFSAQERAKVKDLLKHASKAIQMALEQDLYASMNKFNTK